MAEPVFIPGAPDGPEPAWVREAKARVGVPDGPEPPGNIYPASISIGACFIYYKRLLASASLSKESLDEALRTLRERALEMTLDCGMREADLSVTLDHVANWTMADAKAKVDGTGLLEKMATDLVTVIEVLGT